MPALEHRPLTPALLLVALGAALHSGCGGEVSRSSAAQASEEAGLVILGEGDRLNFHDFGNIPYGTRATHTFVLENTESVPVDILSAQGACSCVRIQSVTYETPGGQVVEGDVRATEGVLVVPPGELVELTVLADTTAVEHPNADKLSIVRLRTDSAHTPFLTFELHLVAEKLFQVTPPTLHMNEVPATAGGAGVARIITGRPNSPARIVGIAEQGDRVTAALEETVIRGESLWTLTVTLPELQPLGPVHDRVVLATTDEEGDGDSGTLEVEVWAQVVDDIVIYPRSPNFQMIEEGAEATIDLELRALVPGARVRIESAEVEGPLADHFTVTHAAVSPDATGRSPLWKLALRADAGLPPGRFAGSLRAVLDDAQNPEVQVRFSGTVRNPP